MPTENDTSTLQRNMLDILEDALKDSADVPTSLRESTLEQFEQALQDATDHPRPPAQVLADWQQTMQSMQDQLRDLQEHAQLSATEAADISRPFDRIAHSFDLAQRTADRGEPAPSASSSPLPRGMPAELAAALKHEAG